MFRTVRSDKDAPLCLSQFITFENDKPICQQFQHNAIQITSTTDRNLQSDHTVNKNMKNLCIVDMKSRIDLTQSIRSITEV